MSAHPRPAPLDPDAQRFWSSVAAGELRLQQCSDCRRFRHPPAPVCAACGSAQSTWTLSPGTGEVWSFTIVHPPTLAAFAGRTPYGAVVVRLDEGVFMVSNVVDCAPSELAVGARVELAITVVEDDLALPLFRRVPS